MVKGFTRDKKFHPISTFKSVRKPKDQKEKTLGVRLKRTQQETLKIKKFEEAGAMAFEDGRSSIPAQDPNLRILLKGTKVGEGSALLKAWIRGYDNQRIKRVNDINRGSDLVKLLPEKDQDDREKFNVTIIDQLNASRVNGFPFFAYTGLKKFVLIGNDTVQFNKVPRNPKDIEKIVIKYDQGQDLYNIILFKRNDPTPINFDGIFFDQLADVIVDGMGVR